MRRIYSRWGGDRRKARWREYSRGRGQEEGQVGRGQEEGQVGIMYSIWEGTGGRSGGENV